MTITLQQNLTAKNWTAAAMVPATWGIGPRTLVNITIHWWGDPVGQTYGGILDWFCNPQSSVGTSAHFVASANQVACIVNPLDAAWHAGSAYGNVHSIGIECNPRCSAADYAAVAWIVAQLRSWYGPLPLVAHNYWTQTTCPGDYRLTNIDALAGKITAQGGNVTPITEDDMTFNLADIFDYPIARRGGQGGTTTLRTTLAFLDSNLEAIPDNILTKPITRGGGVAGSTTLQSVVAYSDANLAKIKPAPVTVTIDAAGIKSLADQIRAQLAPGVVAALAAQLNK